MAFCHSDRHLDPHGHRHGPRRDELHGSRLDTVGYSKSRQTERPLLSYQRQYDVILDSRRYPRLYDAIQDRAALG